MDVKSPGPFGAFFFFFDWETSLSQSDPKPEGVWFQKTEETISSKTYLLSADFYFRLLEL